ncbi:Lactosylceramide 4-alpha-galactosyltransferase [Cladochytrium tenue]|nr:Lactosylceramide 4-alpha-galactosyltransferase [Cladochytrium tenue]
MSAPLSSLHQHQPRKLPPPPFCRARRSYAALAPLRYLTACSWGPVRLLLTTLLATVAFTLVLKARMRVHVVGEDQDTTVRAFAARQHPQEVFESLADAVIQAAADNVAGHDEPGHPDDSTVPRPLTPVVHKPSRPIHEFIRGCSAFDSHFSALPEATSISSGTADKRPAFSLQGGISPAVTPFPEDTPSSPAAAVPPRILFLHYNDRLESPRYLCAIESAARWNPGHSVAILARNAARFAADAAPMLRAAGLASRTVDGGMLGLAAALNDTSSTHDSGATGSATSAPPRVLVAELRWPDAMAGTPLEDWFASGRYLKSNWVSQNLGNAFRLGALHVLGGVYMDLDIVSVNPLPVAADADDDANTNGGSGHGIRALAMQDATWFNNAFLSFPPQDPFLWSLMKEFVRGFEGYVWARNGPRMVTRTFKALCNPPGSHAPPSDAPECNNLSVLDAHVLHPVTYENRHMLFHPWNESCGFLDGLVKKSIGIHWWHHEVGDVSELSSDSVLAHILSRTCPSTIAAYGQAALGISENTSVVEAKKR